MPTPVGFADMAVEMSAVGDDRPYICTLGIETDLATIPPATHCDRVFAAWEQSFLLNQPSFLTLVQVTGRFGQDGADDLIATSTLNNETGAASGTYLPQNTAVLVQKRSALGGRKNRGRMYVPFCASEGSVDNVGNIDSTDLGVLQGLADDFLASLLDADPGPALPMVILHSVSSETPTTVTELRVDPVIATQRRRLRR